MKASGGTVSQRSTNSACWQLNLLPSVSFLIVAGLIGLSLRRSFSTRDCCQVTVANADPLSCW